MEKKPDSPDKEHFDKMLLNEIGWKLDREIWAHVPNPDPSEPWTQSKAREESRKLIADYIGNYDALQSQNERLLSALKEGYITNCLIVPREGDGPLFVDGIPRLDKYAIIPLEKYEQLINEIEKQLITDSGER